MFFLARKDLRHQQMVMSLVMAPLALSQYWFHKDYWQPEYSLSTLPMGSSVIGLEDFLFAFFIGGIASILYEATFRKQHSRGKRRIKETIIAAVVGFSLFLLLYHLGLTTVWASSAALIIIAIALAYLDKDLRVDSIISATLMFILILILYFIWFLLFPHAVSELWLPDSLSGINLLGAPIEELVWYIAWAMFGGIFYEFGTNAGKYRATRK